LTTNLIAIELLFVGPGITHPRIPSDCRGLRVNVGLTLPDGACPAECWLHLDGWQEPSKICGAYQWQALNLALSRLRNELQRLENDGWRFELYEEGSEKLDYTGCGPFLTVEEIFS
jgi:hypothetical protein